jgi:hypothetical protein
MASSSVASSLASMVGVNTANGTVANPTNSGHRSGPGSGVKSAPGMAASLRGPAPPQTPQARQPPGPQQPKQSAKPTQPQTPPKFSAQNPPLGTAPPPAPHPGLIPPYPDARSPQPTLMPNGLMIMPPPAGFIGAGMPPRVPKTFIPGMTGMLGR